METRSVIQASANIIRITNLKKGDVYKRVEDPSYSGPSITYGVVIDLLNDGANCFIEAIEYDKSYGDVKTKVVILSGKKDCALFPVTPEEVKEYLAGAVDGMARAIEEKKKELKEKIEGWEKAKAFVSGETAKQLTGVSFEILPTGELAQPIMAIA